MCLFSCSWGDISVKQTDQASVRHDWRLEGEECRPGQAKLLASLDRAILDVDNIQKRATDLWFDVPVIFCSLQSDRQISR